MDEQDWAAKKRMTMKKKESVNSAKRRGTVFSASRPTELSNVLQHNNDSRRYSAKREAEPYFGSARQIREPQV